MKGVVVNLLKKALKNLDVKIKEEEIESMIESPPDQELGDYAFPCFFLSKTLKLDPHQIALQVRAEMGEPPATDFEDVRVEGPYVNFYMNRKSMAREVVWDVITQKKKYGMSELGKNKRTMIEFPGPNTNKPLHLGHLRNMSIGESVARILEFNGDKVIRANIINDRGIHICKSMLAYQKWGHEQTPEKKKIKSDHFVGDFYVLYSKHEDKKLEKEVQELLQKWEAGDKNTLMLWRVMNEWALEGHAETYKNFKIKHNVTFYESKIYKKGKEMIQQGVKKGIFEHAKGGEIKINLDREGLGEKILLRNDGTALYIVQDLALAKMKFEDYKIDNSIYVVGSEQEYHFKVLFSILKKLGFKKEMHHLSYGMVDLPSGKMKSREGTVVDADDIIEEVKQMAEKELKSRKTEKKLSKSELEKRSTEIALAAIKFFLLKIDSRKGFTFNPKESISFDGDTGPYLMYSYARASSILKKSGTVLKKFEVNEINDKEIELVKKLMQFPEVVKNAYRNLNPSVIANYAFQTAQIFNEFYQTCPVIGSEQETFRLALVESSRQVLKNAMNLLGIDTLEKM